MGQVGRVGVGRKLQTQTSESFGLFLDATCESSCQLDRAAFQGIVGVEREPFLGRVLGDRLQPILVSHSGDCTLCYGRPDEAPYDPLWFALRLAELPCQFLEVLVRLFAAQLLRKGGEQGESSAPGLPVSVPASFVG